MTRLGRTARLAASLALVLPAVGAVVGCSDQAEPEALATVGVCIGRGVDLGDPVEVEAVQGGRVVATGSVSRSPDEPPGTVGLEVSPGPVVVRFVDGDRIGEADVQAGGSLTLSVGEGCDR